MKDIIMLKNLILCLLLSLSFFVLNCDLPQPPPGPEKSSISMFFKSSSGVINDTAITDTSGNVGSVGIVAYLGTFIDSAVLRVTLGTEVVKSYSFKPASKTYDTVYYPVLLTNPGLYDVKVTGFIDKVQDIQDNGTIRIIGRTAGANNPVLSVPGPQSVVNGDKVTFAVSATDLDPGQTVTITTLKKPEYSTFSTNTFEWTPSIKDTGKHIIIFIAADNGFPVMSDTDTVVVTVSKSTVNRAPQWNLKSVQLTAIPGMLFTYPLSSNCVDPDNDVISYELVSAAPVTDTIISATYLFSPTMADTGMNIIRITAKDPSGLTDTLTIELKVSNVAVDIKAPVLKRISPSTDSVIVSSPNIPLTISVNDAGGIDTVKCFMGTTVFNVANSSDSIYTTTVTGLKSNSWNKILFVARDLAMNLCTLQVHLKYDVTASDNVPPVISFLSPSMDTLISTDSFEVKVLCVDDSGISAVKGLCDTSHIDMKKSASVKNLWTGMAKGILASRYSTVKIIATDSSHARNKDSLSVRIKYDNDKTGPSIVLVTPSKDSVTTNTSSYTIVVKVTDPSGLHSVNSIAGLTAYPGVRDTGSLWKISVSSLESNKVTPVIITATDSSLNSNKSMDTVYITSQIINGYSVTFDKNDNNATGTMIRQTINNGASAPLTINGFIKTGWSFDGWATTPAGSVMYKDGAAYTMGTTDITLYAKWSPNIYNVTFDKNDAGATGSMNTQSLSAGSSSQLTANAFVKNGATFAGWALSPSGVVAYADKASFTMGVSNVTLYAKWTANSYSITFDKNDPAATGTMLAQSVASGAAVPLTVNSFTKDGWVFTGWATSTSGKVVYADGSSFTMGVSSVTLYAVWSQNTYLVTFDKNDAAATGTMTPQSIASGAVAPLKTNSYGKTGSAFDGWAVSATGSAVYADGGNFTMGNAGTTLYAKWKVNQYIVSFNSRGGNTVLSQTVIHGDTVTTPLTPVRSGYTFAGWFKDSTYTSAWAFSTEHVTTDMTLYAKWNINTYKLTIVNNSIGGAVTAPKVSPVTVTHGTATTITAEATVGYIFSGWTITTGTASISNASAASTTVMLTTGDATVTPDFKQNIYSLTVSAGTGGSITPSTSPVTVNAGTPTKITAIAAGGYTFAGWTVTSGTATIANANSATTTVTLTSGNATVNAAFSSKTYSLNVVAGTGGAITAPVYLPATVAHGAGTNITATPANGYKFSSWTVTAGTATIASSSSATTTVTLTSGDAAVTANFEVSTYALTVSSTTGGTIKAPASSPVTVNHGIATPITAAASEGYTFTGWTVINGTATIANSSLLSTTVHLSSGNATVRANFSLNTYSLTVLAAGTGGLISIPTSSPVSVNAGAATSIKAAAAAGYTFAGWTVTAGTATIANSGSATTTVTLISGNATISASFLPVLNELPDLVFTNLTITSITATSVAYSYTIKNVGGSDIASLYNVSIQNFYSANTVFNDADDKAAGGSILGVNAGLAANASYSGTFAASGAVPADKPYVTAKIDWGEIISEGNESNNTAFSAVPTENNLPDLVFTNLTITSITATSVAYSYTIKNVGGSDIASLYNVSIQNFYSANTVFYDADDKAAGGSILGVNVGLAANAIYSGTYYASGAVPADKPYLTAKIDWGEIIGEGNESNNTVAKLIQ
jgi:uncharacterized repeat protein (TIGR02543 family)